MGDNTALFSSSGSGGESGSDDSTPFVDGAQINAERLAAAALGFIGAQYAAGLSTLIAAVFAFVTSPFRAFKNGYAMLASGLTSGPTQAIEVAYSSLEETVAGLGPLGFVVAIAAVLVIAYIATYGRDLLG